MIYFGDIINNASFEIHLIVIVLRLLKLRMSETKNIIVLDLALPAGLYVGNILQQHPLSLIFMAAHLPQQANPFEDEKKNITNANAFEFATKDKTFL